MHVSRSAVVAAVILGLVLPGVLWSADPEVDRLKREREALDRRIADLEGKGPKKTYPVGPEGDEEVVTPTKVQTPAGKTGVSVSVVTQEQILALSHAMAQDALRFVPGLHFARTAGRGGQTSLFTRGGESDYTLVLLDGFKVNTDGGTFDWEFLTVDGASRIEVIRGAGSSPYGSDAVAGVVNVLTERGSGPPTLLVAGAGGNYGTHRERMRLSGGTPDHGYAIDGSYVKQDSGPFENSDFEDLGFAGRFDHKLTDVLDLTFNVRSVTGERGVYTTGSGQRFEPPDPNDKRMRADLLTGVTVRSRPDEQWESQLRFFRYAQQNKSSILRDNHISTGSGRDGSDFLILTNFDRLGADWQNVWAPTQDAKLIGGLEYEHETYDTEETDEGRANQAAYFESQAGWEDALYLTAGVRFDRQSDFGDETTGKCSAAYLLPTDTRVRAAAGSGIKAPTFAEVVGDSFTPGLRGRNEGPRVEKSRTYEAGLDQDLFEKALRFSATGFYNLYHDLVEYENATTGYGQGGNAFSRGTETQIQWKPARSLDFTANWTNLSTQVTSTRVSGTSYIRGDQLLRRPHNSGNLVARHRPFGDERLEATAAVRYVGDRDDRDFYVDPAGRRVDSPDYTVWELGASWRFAQGWRLFGAAQNLLNDHYEEIYAFPSDGRTWLVGLEYTLRL